MRMLWIFWICFCTIILVGCKDQLDHEYERIETTFSDKIGSDTDYYIGYNGIDGRFVHVGIIYGQIDDKKLCEEFVTLYNASKGANAYLCRAAN